MQFIYNQKQTRSIRHEKIKHIGLYNPLLHSPVSHAPGVTPESLDLFNVLQCHVSGGPACA